MALHPLLPLLLVALPAVMALQPDIDAGREVPSLEYVRAIATQEPEGPIAREVQGLNTSFLQRYAEAACLTGFRL